MSQKKHAKFAASSASRWLTCPGSIHLSEKVPPQAESKYAVEGTIAHACLEEMLKGEKIAKLKTKYSEEMVEHGLNAYFTIMEVFEASKGSELLCETSSSLSFIHPDMFGTFDAAVVEEFGTLTIFDYKYGKAVVNPEENPQMSFYALGLAHRYHYNFQDAELVIIQPRAESESVRKWKTSIETLQTWGNLFLQAAQRAETKNPPLKAGSHCKYCPAYDICPETNKKRLAKAIEAFS